MFMIYISLLLQQCPQQMNPHNQCNPIHQIRHPKILNILKYVTFYTTFKYKYIKIITICRHFYNNNMMLLM